MWTTSAGPSVASFPLPSLTNSSEASTNGFEMTSQQTECEGKRDPNNHLNATSEGRASLAFPRALGQRSMERHETTHLHCRRSRSSPWCGMRCQRDARLRSWHVVRMDVVPARSLPSEIHIQDRRQLYIRRSHSCSPVHQGKLAHRHLHDRQQSHNHSIRIEDKRDSIPP